VTLVESLTNESPIATQSALFSRVVEHQQPLVIPDITTAIPDARSPWFSQLSVHGYAAIPIATSGRKPYGVMTVGDVKTLALSADQIDAMMMAGRLLADDIEHRNAPHEDTPTQIKPAADTWEALALTDPLTGLYNRRAGEQAIAREAARVRRMGSRVSLAMFDLDHFKVVNDTHGHDVGDKVLTEIGRILRSSFRQSDLAIRWGGDEFVVLLPDVPLSGAGAFADRARRQVEALSFSGIGRVTLSAGVAEMDRDEEPAVTLKRADTCLYEAKAGGRNRTKGAPNSSSSSSAQVIAS
jgi:diguanylate cyclase (GGDEF)-like protein